MKIDETDQKLIALLRTDARMATSDLARRLTLARSTVQARIERLERAGVIAGYTLRTGAGLPDMLRATALLTIEPRSGPGVIDRLKSMPGIERVHTTSGRFDLLVQIAARTTQELDSMLDHIGAARGVRSSESLVHLSTKIDNPQ